MCMGIFASCFFSCPVILETLSCVDSEDLWRAQWLVVSYSLRPAGALGGLQCGVVWWRALVFYLECVSKCSMWLRWDCGCGNCLVVGRLVSHL